MADKIQTKWEELTGIMHEHALQLVSGDDFYGEGYEDCERRLFDDTKIYTRTGWKAGIDLDNTVHLLVKEAIDNYGRTT